MAAFDAIVVGAGQAGPALAFRLAAGGRRVALVERAEAGGTCVNTGCTPTKTLVASARVAHLARRAADYGVVLPGPVGVDWPRVKARMDAVVAKSRDGLTGSLEATENLTFLRGHARFTGPHAVAVEGRALEAPWIFLDVGAHAVAPPIPGLDRVPWLDNARLLRIEALPRHLAIIGGSYIGLEFAQVFRRLGAEVTVLEASPRVIPREDEAVSATIREMLEAEGVRFHLGARGIAVAPAGDGVTVALDGAAPIQASHLLVAAGRRPNTDDLGLDAAGIAVDARGAIPVDDALQTSAPGVWALGECNGRGAFTHTAWNDYEIVAANLLDGEARRVTDRIACYGLFTDPPLGRIGMTEAEARAAGHRLLVGHRPMSRVNRAVEKGETTGFMSVLVDADTRMILGAAILGTDGDEAVHGMLDLMQAGVPYTSLLRTVHIHPTVSELIPTMLGDLKPG
ncbi:FAD-containing oxidoreductase [Paracraurococcus ruber]|uniref:Mercuric reductase n=1 Tax=Paracraurococcus ruber TaxID=77675 RepID=A0ABS1CX51_9PROT|nr:FAD-containing oxidoreductase [Paracraurococcus ruber]MBK1658821.1 mercuric reductase [Paracraurococcus ruber]TDG29768.1 FAD-containing oxidoreductase [Paracraurococcus ruber]